MRPRKKSSEEQVDGMTPDVWSLVRGDDESALEEYLRRNEEYDEKIAEVANLLDRAVLDAKKRCVELQRCILLEQDDLKIQQYASELNVERYIYALTLARNAKFFNRQQPDTRERSRSVREAYFEQKMRRQAADEESALSRRRRELEEDENRSRTSTRESHSSTSRTMKSFSTSFNSSTQQSFAHSSSQFSTSFTDGVREHHEMEEQQASAHMTVVDGMASGEGHITHRSATANERGLTSTEHNEQHVRIGENEDGVFRAVPIGGGATLESITHLGRADYFDHSRQEAEHTDIGRKISNTVPAHLQPEVRQGAVVVASGGCIGSSATLESITHFGSANYCQENEKNQIVEVPADQEPPAIVEDIVHHPQADYFDHSRTIPEYSQIVRKISNTVPELQPDSVPEPPVSEIHKVGSGATLETLTHIGSAEYFKERYEHHRAVLTGQGASGSSPSAYKERPIDVATKRDHPNPSVDSVEYIEVVDLSSSNRAHDDSLQYDELESIPMEISQNSTHNNQEVIKKLSEESNHGGHRKRLSQKISDVFHRKKKHSNADKEVVYTQEELDEIERIKNGYTLSSSGHHSGLHREDSANSQADALSIHSAHSRRRSVVDKLVDVFQKKTDRHSSISDKQDHSSCTVQHQNLDHFEHVLHRRLELESLPLNRMVRVNNEIPTYQDNSHHEQKKSIPERVIEEVKKHLPHKKHGHKNSNGSDHSNEGRTSRSSTIVSQADADPSDPDNIENRLNRFRTERRSSRTNVDHLHNHQELDFQPITVKRHSSDDVGPRTHESSVSSANTVIEVVQQKPSEHFEDVAEEVDITEYYKDDEHQYDQVYCGEHAVTETVTRENANTHHASEEHTIGKGAELNGIGHGATVSGITSPPPEIDKKYTYQWRRMSHHSLLSDDLYTDEIRQAHARTMSEVGNNEVEDIMGYQDVYQNSATRDREYTPTPDRPFSVPPLALDRVLSPVMSKDHEQRSELHYDNDLVHKIQKTLEEVERRIHTTDSSSHSTLTEIDTHYKASNVEQFSPNTDDNHNKMDRKFPNLNMENHYDRVYESESHERNIYDEVYQQRIVDEVMHSRQHLGEPAKTERVVTPTPPTTPMVSASTLDDLFAIREQFRNKSIEDNKKNSTIREEVAYDEVTTTDVKQVSSRVYNAYEEDNIYEEIDAYSKGLSPSRPAPPRPRERTTVPSSDSLYERPIRRPAVPESPIPSTQKVNNGGSYQKTKQKESTGTSSLKKKIESGKTKTPSNIIYIPAHQFETGPKQISKSSSHIATQSTASSQSASSSEVRRSIHELDYSKNRIGSGAVARPTELHYSQPGGKQPVEIIRVITNDGVKFTEDREYERNKYEEVPIKEMDDQEALDLELIFTTNAIRQMSRNNQWRDSIRKGDLRILRLKEENLEKAHKAVPHNSPFVRHEEILTPVKTPTSWTKNNEFRFSLPAVAHASREELHENKPTTLRDLIHNEDILAQERVTKEHVKESHYADHRDFEPRPQPVASARTPSSPDLHYYPGFVKDIRKNFMGNSESSSANQQKWERSQSIGSLYVAEQKPKLIDNKPSEVGRPRPISVHYEAAQDNYEPVVAYVKKPTKEHMKTPVEDRPNGFRRPRPVDLSSKYLDNSDRFYEMPRHSPELARREVIPVNQIVYSLPTRSAPPVEKVEEPRQITEFRRTASSDVPLSPKIPVTPYYFDPYDQQTVNSSVDMAQQHNETAHTSEKSTNLAHSAQFSERSLINMNELPASNYSLSGRKRNHRTQPEPQTPKEPEFLRKYRELQEKLEAARQRDIQQAEQQAYMEETASTSSSMEVETHYTDAFANKETKNQTHNEQSNTSSSSKATSYTVTGSKAFFGSPKRNGKDDIVPDTPTPVGSSTTNRFSNFESKRTTVDSQESASSQTNHHSSTMETPYRVETPTHQHQIETYVERIEDREFLPADEMKLVGMRKAYMGNDDHRQGYRQAIYEVEPGQRPPGIPGHIDLTDAEEVRVETHTKIVTTVIRKVPDGDEYVTHSLNDQQRPLAIEEGARASHSRSESTDTWTVQEKLERYGSSDVLAEQEDVPTTGNSQQTTSHDRHFSTDSVGRGAGINSRRISTDTHGNIVNIHHRGHLSTDSLSGGRLNERQRNYSSDSHFSLASSAVREAVEEMDRESGYRPRDLTTEEENLLRSPLTPRSNHQFTFETRPQESTSHHRTSSTDHQPRSGHGLGVPHAPRTPSPLAAERKTSDNQEHYSAYSGSEQGTSEVGNNTLEDPGYTTYFDRNGVLRRSWNVKTYDPNTAVRIGPSKTKLRKMPDIDSGISSGERASPEKSVEENAVLKDWNPRKLIDGLYEVSYEPRIESKRDRFTNMEGHVEVPSDETSTVAELERNWKEQYMRTKDGRLQIFVTHFAGEAPVSELVLSGADIDANREERTLYIHGGREHIKVLIRIPKCQTAEKFDKWRQALLSHAASSTMDAYVQPTPRSLPSIHDRTVIIELGSCSIRGGVLCQKPILPQTFFPAIGCVMDDGSIVVGADAYAPENRHRGELVRPIQATDPSVERYTIDSAVTKACILKVVKDLGINPANYKVLLSIPQNIPGTLIGELLSAVLNDIKFQSAAITRQPSLILYAYDVTTGVVVDIGDRLNIVPVIDGYMVESAIVSIPYGALQIRDALRTSLANHNKGLFSFQSPCEKLILRYVMEHSCYVPADYSGEENGDNNKDVHVDLGEFDPTAVMPTKFNIDSSRFMCTEGLFRPKKWGMETKGIHQLINDAVVQSPIDSRRTLFRNIYLAGGASLLPGLAEKLETELSTIVPSTIHTQVHISPWRYNAAFLGAQIVAASNTFEDSCITAAKLPQFLTQLAAAGF